MRRVVVTVSAWSRRLAAASRRAGRNFLAGKSGAVRVTDFPVDDIACQIACQIPRGDDAEGKFNPDEWMEPKEQRKVDDFIVYADGGGRLRRSPMPAGIPRPMRIRSRPAC